MIKNKKLRITFRIIFCVLFTFILYLYVGFILMPKTVEDKGGLKYYSTTSYIYEPKNSIDVMMFGNSDLYNGFSPIELYKETGIISFNCGKSQQTVPVIYEQLKKTLTLQQPKLVILEADCIFYDKKEFAGNNYNAILLRAPVKYHVRWKDLTLKDFYTVPTMKNRTNYLKGFVFDGRISGYKVSENYMKDFDAEPKEIKENAKKYLIKCVDLCKENNIPFLIMGIPSPNTWSMACNKGLNKFVNEYNENQLDYKINCIDMNLKPEKLVFNFDTYFKDNGNHCNYMGAKAVTSFMGNYLKENYPFLKDRRNDNVSNWNKSVKMYDNYIAKHHINKDKHTPNNNENNANINPSLNKSTKNAD